MRVARDEDFVEGLALIDQGIHDPAVMPFQVPFTDTAMPLRQWDTLRYWWSTRSSFQPDSWNLEFFVYAGGVLIGVQGMHTEKFSLLREGSSGSWLGHAHQRQGYGTEMRTALLALAFDHLGAQVMRSAAFLNNPGSTGVSARLGYELDGTKTSAPRGVPVTSQQFRLTRERWSATRRALAEDVTVSGLAPCLALLGLDTSS